MVTLAPPERKRFRFHTNWWADAMISSRAAAALYRKRNREKPLEDDETLLRVGLDIIVSLDANLNNLLVSCGVNKPRGDEKSQPTIQAGGVERYRGFDGAMKKLKIPFVEYYGEIQSYLRCLSGLLNPSQESPPGFEDIEKTEQFFRAYSLAC